MKRHARGLAVVGLLALGVWLLMAPAGQSADPKESPAKGDILKLADVVGKGGNGAAQAAAIRKKLGDDGLGDVMQLFKKRDKGGLGIGTKPGAITPDGIELMIQLKLSRAKSAPPAGAKADLERMADIAKAVAEVTKLYAPTEKKAGKDPANWKKYANDMDKGAKNLKDAIKGGNAAKIKAAATDLNAACTNCHSEFRD